MTIYVPKDKFDDKFNKINNSFISIEDSFGDYYSVQYNDVLYNRLKKIVKINKIIVDDYILYISIIDYCILICIKTNGIIEKVLVEELTKNINMEILEKIRQLSDGSNI